MNELPLNKIIHGDCLEFMKTLPDKCIDLVLTDPPYGINADKGVGGFGVSRVTAKHYEGDWDSKTPDKAYFDEILRIGKKVVIFGGNFFTDKLPVNGHWIVWDKKGGIAFDNPFGDCELAYTNVNKKSVKKYTQIQQGFISEEKERYHPTQKPVTLLRRILRDYLENDKTDTVAKLVFDPFAGGGSTLIACKMDKIDYIGCEISPEYCKIAQERIDALDRQPDLFDN